jgi:hypothetical protein
MKSNKTTPVKHENKQNNTSKTSNQTKQQKKNIKTFMFH